MNAIVKAKPRASGVSDEALGKKIRAARTLIKMSQGDLGEKLGVSFQQVQKYEKGANRISQARLVEIALAVGQPISYFLGDGGAISKEMQEVQDCIATREGMDLIKAFVKLKHASQKVAIISLVKEMAR